MFDQPSKGLIVMKHMQRQKRSEKRGCMQALMCTCCCGLFWLPLLEVPVAGTDLRSQERLAEGWLVVPSPSAGWTAEGLSALAQAVKAGARPLSESRCGHKVPIRGSSLTSVMVLHGEDRLSSPRALQQPTKRVN